MAAATNDWPSYIDHHVQLDVTWSLATSHLNASNTMPSSSTYASLIPALLKSLSPLQLPHLRPSGCVLTSANTRTRALWS